MGKSSQLATPLSAGELHDRVHALELPLERVAPLLGLSVSGLVKQMSGQRPVTPQTALLIAYVERDHDALSSVREAFALDRIGKPRLPWMHRKATIAWQRIRAGSLT
jgi:hypothetical protein